MKKESCNLFFKNSFRLRGLILLLLVFSTSYMVGCGKDNEVSPTPPPPPPPPSVEVDWELVFQDDFNGTAVDQSAWGMYNGPGHAGNGLRRPEAFSVADGILTVTAQMVDGQLVSGGMAHKQNLTYGKFEARVRADVDSSFATSAVLLTWPQSENWPVDGENDFYETTTNDRQSFHTFIHYGADNKQFHKEHDFDATKWLTVAMEWDPNWIKIYVNGNLQWTLTEKQAIPDVPHHLCIQLDAFQKTMTGVTRMQVDWVKVYKRVVKN